MKLKDLVIVIKNLLEADFTRDTNYQNDAYDLQNIIVGNGRWNEAKDANSELQTFESLMGLLFLDELETIERKKLIRLFHIFVNLFQLSYIENKHYVPDLQKLLNKIEIVKYND